jgi:hypothetical protein
MRVMRLSGQGNRVVDVEEFREWSDQVGKIREIILRAWRLPFPAPQDDLLIDQLDPGLGLVREGRLPVEIELDRIAFATHPVHDLLRDNSFEAWVDGVNGGRAGEVPGFSH